MSTAIFDDISPIEHCINAEYDFEVSKNTKLITWNPSDRKFPQKDYNLKWHSMISEVLNKIKKSCKYYCLVPEVSLKGRLHVHGWVIINDNIKWIKQTQPMLFRTGNISIKPCYSINGIEYSKKDLYGNQTQNLLHDAIPLTHYTNDDYRELIMIIYLEKAKQKVQKMDLGKFFGIEEDDNDYN